MRPGAPRSVRPGSPGNDESRRHEYLAALVGKAGPGGIRGGAYRSACFLVESNAWINRIDASSAWHNWAVDPLQACSERAPLHISHAIWTE